MIHFGGNRSIIFYDKHSTDVLFATFLCRGVEKVLKKIAIDPVARNKKCVHHFNKIFVWMESFEGLKDCNATLNVNVVLVHFVKT